MTGRSLRLRLLVMSAASVALALGLAVFGLTELFRAHVERRAIEELSDQLDRLLAGIDRAPDGSLAAGAGLSDPRLSRPLGGLYWQVDTGNGLLRSRSLWDYTLPMPTDEPGDGAIHAHRLDGPDGAPVLAVERSARLPSRLGKGTVRAVVAVEAARLQTAAAEFRRDLLPFTGLLGLFLVAAGAIQVTVGLRPLAAIGRRVARVRSGESHRVGEDFPTEIVPLARELDALLAQREEEIVRARYRAGDLAHGLKTPLQALMGEAGRLREKGDPSTADTIERIADTMHRHVDRELARVRAAGQTPTARCDLAQTVSRVIDVVRRAGRGGTLDWRMDLTPGLTVPARAEDLAEVVGALAENAARHAVRQVEIVANAASGAALLTIRDDGPGIPPNAADRLLQRGARADETGPGTGLGLAIAREITESLGGTISLSDAAPGLRVELRLPLAPARDGTGS